ncbi:uncharacterized protein LOC111912109 [Lactuca sativa]|uniref:uncharacterized protein LOC111912109 n=1 Tax=Lactuca sativa TaxID=4236 RepID=UPI000CD94C0A|nr:uncharacterized protein LOC111912109 [Lactuca sativa]
MATVVEAFKMGLKKDSPFYEDLVMTPCVIIAMHDLGNKARWPRKAERSIAWKDKSKLCSYHQDFGHVMEDCITLRNDISYLLGKGYLKEILGRRKEKTKEKDQDPKMILERPGSPHPPTEAKVINVISRGSNIYGTSYSAAKRHAMVSKTQKEKGQKKTTITNEKEITFDEADRQDAQDPHYEGLVITLYIVNHIIRRILFDGGYSVNIILLDALKRMNIIESEIFAKSSVLIGFSGETKKTIGKIKLPIYLEGVNSV